MERAHSSALSSGWPNDGLVCNDPYFLLLYSAGSCVWRRKELKSLTDFINTCNLNFLEL